MKEMEFTVIVHPDEEGGYWTDVPTLPGCGSQGDTLEEALENTREAIFLMVEHLQEKGQSITIERDIVVKVTVAV